MHGSTHLPLALCCVALLCRCGTGNISHPDVETDVTTIPFDSGNRANDAATPTPDAGRSGVDASDGSPGADVRDSSSGPDVGDGSSGVDGSASGMTAGCGMAATGTSSYVRNTMMIGSTVREYYLFVPNDYDATRAYPLVFRWHGSGGNGTSGGLEIEAASGDNAIIASPSGINGDWDLSPNGVDVALFDALLAALESRYCIDGNRVFSYGFSDGAGFTNLLGCVRSDVLRAVAPVEGWAPQTTNCGQPIAAWITHSADDQTVTIDQGEAARDLFLQLDGCTTTTMPVSPSPCVQYGGCADHPVDWCETSGPHNPQGAFTGPGAWSFFQTLL